MGIRFPSQHQQPDFSKMGQEDTLNKTAQQAEQGARPTALTNTSPSTQPGTDSQTNQTEEPGRVEQIARSVDARTTGRVIDLLA